MLVLVRQKSFWKSLISSWVRWCRMFSDAIPRTGCNAIPVLVTLLIARTCLRPSAWKNAVTAVMPSTLPWHSIPSRLCAGLMLPHSALCERKSHELFSAATLSLTDSLTKMPV
ncbi:hypothetical protein RvY_12177-2 [Ramazzottius varieornatus]|uniref:Uncharacterized protein n=1 Tax=Ramazzottius varieornatus TaxID=947166 RepID=A0A1D1VP11_RAMVA|nr:hypothetical protein RvY_12177-2 [Ramazzottius varieornatus]